MPMKNMGTATMRFKEGIKIEGDDPHGSANQLVVTGSISLMEGSGGAVTATLESSANPTTSETTPNDWEFISGGTSNSSHSNYQPRIPILKIPIDTGGFWEDEIYAFTGSGGSGNLRMISNKNAISGDTRIEFKLIGGGNHNVDSSSPYFAGYIKRADKPNATGYPDTLEHPAMVWLTATTDPTFDIQVMVATSGYDANANWTQVGSSSYHAHGPNHPSSGSRNLNQNQFQSFSVDITGITGNYYVALVQDGSSQYNTWAAADINLYSLSGGGSSTSYINFEPQGTFYEGEDGIGFRNNEGIMEYKDEGDSWRQFNTLAIGPASPDRSIQFNDGGTLGSGNLFYGGNANVGIGNFPDPSTDIGTLLEVRGNLGGGDNAGHVTISDRGVKPPFLNLERYAGQQGSETGLTQDDDMGTIQWKGYNGTALETVARIQGQFQTGVANAGHIIFSASETDDGTVSKVLRLRRVGLVPHDDITTSNKADFVIGSGYNAIDTVYAETLQGPIGMDMQVKGDNSDVIMHIGTQGTYANNVGIGTSTPAYPLVVEGTHTTEPDTMILNGTTNGPTLSISRKESLVTDVNSGETLSTIKMGVHTSAQLEAINIIAKATTDWDSNFMNVSRGTQLVFQTTTGLESNVVTADRMTIDSQKVHCLDSLEVDGDAEIGNGLTVNLSAEFGSSVYVDNNMYMNKWISHDTITGRSSGIGSIGSTVQLAEYTDGVMNNNSILTFNPNNDDLRVQYRDTNGRETFRCDYDGLTYIGTDDGAPQYSAHGYSLIDSGGLYIEGEHNSGSVATIVNRGENDDSDGLRIIIGYGRYGYANDVPTVYYREPVDTNSFLKFSGRDRGSGVTPTGAQYANNFNPDDLFEVGRIAGDGNGGITIIGDTFTGTHDTISSESIEIGMIVESTGELWVSNGISCSLPKTQMTSTKNSKSVFGVVSRRSIENGRADKVPDGFNPYTVNSLGEGKVWITNVSGEPTNGDYITSSTIVGYGQLQTDDILHSYTVAKLTETIDWSNVAETISHAGQTYKKYLAACTYHCG